MNQHVVVEVTSPAVQTHLGIIQGVVQRMSANSASCKAFCVTLVSAILVVVADKGKPDYSLLALLPVFVFWLLDVYYLSLEKGFRNAYNDFVSKLCRQNLYDRDLFSVGPIGDVRSLQIEAMKSFSTWGLYLPLGLLVFLTRYLVVG